MVNSTPPQEIIGTVLDSQLISVAGLARRLNMSKDAIYHQIRSHKMGEAEEVYRPLGRGLRIKQDLFLRARTSNPPSTNSDGRLAENAKRLLAAVLPLRTEIDHLIAEANQVYEAATTSDPQEVASETSSGTKSKKPPRRAK
jgi:hypothetical protein